MRKEFRSGMALVLGVSIAFAQTGWDHVALLGSGINLSEWLEAYWEADYPV